MTRANKLYRRLYIIFWRLFCALYPVRIIGAENIPQGAALACANHTSLLDAFFLAVAFGRDNHMHIIAKKELFRIPVLSFILRRLEMICVDREISDISTIRASLGYMKRGEKVAIFPEGTRVLADDAVAAKRGAIWLAERAGVPIVPVYIATRKRLFCRHTIVIGEAYEIPKSTGKRAQEEYPVLADELMEKIRELGRGDMLQRNARRAARHGRSAIGKPGNS